MFGIYPDRPVGLFLPLDVDLVNALREYSDGLCPTCGHPAIWCYNPRSAAWYAFDPDPPECVVCEIIEADNADPNRKSEPGVKRRIRDLRFEDDNN